MATISRRQRQGGAQVGHKRLPDNNDTNKLRQRFSSPDDKSDLDSPSPISHEKQDFGSEKDTKKKEARSSYYDYPILQYIQDNVIGHDLVIQGPFGPRQVIYCDYTASGRCLSFIEDYIRSTVFPTYANTHSSTGHNARQTGKFREEARGIIKKCVNASKDDVVVFTGSGATAGLHKVAWALKVNISRVADETAVFIGPYEHHSNILLWREYGTQVVRIRDDKNGLIDLVHLRNELKFWKEKRRQLIVTMSAASNVTGIITDTDAVAKIAHQFGALAIFDFAAGGPYLDIDMNPSRKEYKDAVIISPHKFVGGPGTPGLIIAKKWIFRNPVPDRVGGGTVTFVTRETHGYTSNIEEKEEGGTPAIIESIRAGLAFQLKQEVGVDVIDHREEEICKRAFSVWQENPNIHILGSHSVKRVTIFSFVTIHTETGRMIHHNFISTLLSDLFGIQARGGCACAGPYAEELLGISEPMAKRFARFVSVKPSGQNSTSPNMCLEIMKPGFTRINLSYFYDDESIDYVISAIDMVTRYGWKLLPEYSFNCQTGSWYHKAFSNTEAYGLHSLMDISYSNSGMAHNKRQPSASKQRAISKEEALNAAEKRFMEAADSEETPRASSASLVLRENLPRDKRGLRWFVTPQEAISLLKDREENYLRKKRFNLPFKLKTDGHIKVSEKENDPYIGSPTSSDPLETYRKLPPIQDKNSRQYGSNSNNSSNNNSINYNRSPVSNGNRTQQRDGKPTQQ